MKRALFGLVLLVTFVAGGAWLLHASIEADDDPAGRSDTTERMLSLAEVKSWGYRVQGLDVAAGARAHFDLMVIDPTEVDHGRDRMLATLQRKPDGTRRIVLAQLSIGEAEDTRAYWRREWVTELPVPPRQSSIGADPPSTAYGLAAALHSRPETAAAIATTISGSSGLRVPSPTAPTWLGTENPEGHGNYKVRFWDAGWQTLIFGSAEAALDRIMALGFDGVYLQRADVDGAIAAEHAGAETDMVDFIVRLSEYARQHRPGFLVVMHNAEELLAHRRLRRAIDAVAKEDLLYGVTGPGEENGAADVKASLYYLEQARRTGRPVFIVETLEDAAKVAEAKRRLTELGFVAYFASRERGRLKLEF